MKRTLFILFLFLCAAVGFAREINLVQNPGFESVAPGTPTPLAYQLAGAAAWGRVGGEDELTTNGIIFPGDAPGGGSVAQTVPIEPAKGVGSCFVFAAGRRMAFASRTIRFG